MPILEPGENEYRVSVLVAGKTVGEAIDQAKYYVDMRNVRVELLRTCPYKESEVEK